MNLTEIMDLKTYENKVLNQKMLYTVYVPKAKRTAYKVFIFFHGAGERGNDGFKPIEYHAGIIKKIIAHPVYGKETICIAPQVPDEERWVPIDDIKNGTYQFDQNPRQPIHDIFEDFLENGLAKTYQVDPKHIYLGGLSMGGTGTIHYLTHYPNKFAAGIAICGTMDLNKVDVLAKTPLWLFHSSDDNVVNYLPFKKGYQALKHLKAPVKYTEYDDTGHGSWHKAYETDGLLDWLFSHHR